MIEIKNISKQIGKQKILNNVCFNIPKNKIIGFIGDNGAGKTSTIKCIFGEFKIDSGEILFEGEDIKINNNIQKLAFFPDSNNIPLDLTVLDFMDYVASLKGIDNKKIKINSDKIILFLNLEKYKNKKLKQLSAGLKKRAIMAATLILQPEYIILDEPTANLDIDTKLEFLNILKKLNTKGITIMITSHLIDELQELIDYLVIIKNGEVVYNNEIDVKKEKIVDIYNQYINKPELNLEMVDEIYE